MSIVHSVWYSPDSNFVPPSDEPAEFALPSPPRKWGASGTLGTAGGTVTWSLAGGGWTNQTGANFFSGQTVALQNFMPADYVSQITSAFSAWAQVANISFVQVADGGGNFGVGTTGNIRIGGGFIDGFNQNGSVVGRAFFPPNGGNSNASATSGDMVFDSGDSWSSSLVFSVALHEIGHSLGLDHVPQNNPTAVMNPTLHLGLPLQPDDIAGIRAIYGTSAPPPPPPVFHPAALGVAGFGTNPGAGGWGDFNTYPRLLGSVNGDALADVVGFGSAGTFVSLATGLGQFAPAMLAIAAFGNNPSAGGWDTQDHYPRRIADVNGDGRSDLIAFGELGTFVAFGQTNGTFGAPITASTGFGASVAAGGWSSDDVFHREVADVNGDLRADIVGFGAAGVFVALAQADGTFAASIVASNQFGSNPAAGGWTSQNQFPRIVADVNADQRGDIIAFGAAGVFVAFGQANGTFGAAFQASTGFGSNASAGGWTSQQLFTRAVGDINADGRGDIVGFGAAGAYYALGQAGGTFGPTAFGIAAFGANPEAGGWTDNNIFGRTLADVTGDNRDDIIGFGAAGVFVSAATDFLV